MNMLRDLTVAVVEGAAALVLALLVYRMYGSFSRNRWWVTCLVVLGWAMCFFVTLLITNDVGYALGCSEHEDCQPERLLQVVWAVLYWGALFLTFCVYPLAEDYVKVGDFTVRDRLTAVVRKNLMIYGIMVSALALAGLIYGLISGFDWSRFPAVASATADLYGLVLFVLLLGHGLANIPRRLYRRSEPKMLLARAHFDLAEYTDRSDQASDRLREVVRQVREMDRAVAPGDTFRPYADQVVAKCPTEGGYDPALFPSNNHSFEVSYENIVRLHADLKTALYEQFFCEHMRKQSLDAALWMREVLDTSIPCEGRGRREAIRLGYFRYVHRIVMDLFAAWCVVLSLVILVSELLFSFDVVNMSLLSLWTHASWKVLPWPVMQVVIAAPLLYIAYCAYSSLFQVRIFSYYRLVTGGGSSCASLIFSASYLCRLISPMAYNYMLMLHVDNTAFLSEMGSLDLSALGRYAQDFVPMLVALSFAATVFKIYARIAGAVCGRRFQFDDKSLSAEHVRRGEMLSNHEYTQYLARSTSSLPLVASDATFVDDAENFVDIELKSYDE